MSNHIKKMQRQARLRRKNERPRTKREKFFFRVGALDGIDATKQRVGQLIRDHGKGRNAVKAILESLGLTETKSGEFTFPARQAFKEDEDES